MKPEYIKINGRVVRATAEEIERARRADEAVKHGEWEARVATALRPFLAASVDSITLTDDTTGSLTIRAGDHEVMIMAVGDHYGDSKIHIYVDGRSCGEEG